MTRSHPRRVNTDSGTATSSGVPRCRRPPISEYSPSLFSRTISMSMSAGPRPASGDLAPLRRRTGRRLTYWWNPRRIGMKSPERDVVGHAGESDGAEEDRLELPEPVQTVLGHHAAGLREALAAPVERRPLDVEAEPAAGGVEDAHALGHDFLADPIAGDRRDAVLHANTSVVSSP